jgi:lysophospholipase-3
VEDMTLEYNTSSKKTFNKPGVRIEIEGFGDTGTVEYLDEIKYPGSGYFNIITEVLVKRFNHKRGKTIRGVPYDWRRAPNELHELFTNFTLLVQETYEANNQTRVILVAHSLGK